MMSSLTSMSDILLKLKETLTEFVELYFTVNGQAEDGNNNTSTAENRHDVSQICTKSTILPSFD